MKRMIINSKLVSKYAIKTTEQIQVGTKKTSSFCKDMIMQKLIQMCKY
jgi:hypothetical protein